MKQDAFYLLPFSPDGSVFRTYHALGHGTIACGPMLKSDGAFAMTLPRLATTLLLPMMMLVGCANESTPYNEQTAQIDPAMNQSDPPQDADYPESTPDPLEDGLDAGPDEKVKLTDEQWKAILSEEEYDVLRRSGTERAFTGRYHDHDLDVKGAFHCAGCGQYLYDVQHKFHSGCGWPSFYQAVAPGAITEHRDTSHGMVRTEMRCARCDGHLGHIFNDGLGTPTGMRHCVNGTALIFVPKGQAPKDVIRAHRQKHANQ